MSCCGQQRAALRSTMQRPQALATAPAQSVPPVLQAPIGLVHRGGSATVARGERTGLTYLFGPGGSALEVDGRDAQALIASGSFTAAG